MDIERELSNLVEEAAQEKGMKFRSLLPFIITLKDLREQKIPSREFILEEWMPKDSFGMVYAPRGVGKTWFCMASAIAIAEGRTSFFTLESSSEI